MKGITNPIALYVLAGLLTCRGQEFRNLDFEQANVLLGMFGSVSASNAVPGWQVLWGEELASTVLHNGVPIGSVAVSLLDVRSLDCCIIEGAFTAALSPGIRLVDPMLRDAALAQVGHVPLSSLSLQFKLAPGSDDNLVVRFGSEVLGLSRLQTTSAYNLYGADIGKFAGQTAELRFTALYTPQQPLNPVFLDSIQFSTQPVPEPGMWALFGLGSVLLWFTMGYRQKRWGRKRL